MDLREIQKLHAQFPPDSMTIDLPRQIAALPAPAVFESDGKSSNLTSRMTKTGPVLRSCSKPLLIALVVAMAGVGAARIWHAVGAGAVQQKSSVEKAGLEKSDKTTPSVVAGEPAVRPIDASPARPVAAAPMLSASDLGGAPTVGLTADQFRNSLGTNPTSSSGNSTVGKPASAASNEAQLAAVSPIRQSRRDSESAHAPAAPNAAAAQPESKPTGPITAQSVAQPSPTTTAPAAVTDHGASSVAVPTRTHSYRHHVSRPRDEQSTEGDAQSAASNKKPAPANRAGANEVQMF